MQSQWYSKTSSRVPLNTGREFMQISYPAPNTEK